MKSRLFTALQGTNPYMLSGHLQSFFLSPGLVGISFCSFGRPGNAAPSMLKNEFDRNNQVPFTNPSFTNQRLKLFWIGVGKDDGLYPVINDYLKVLDEKKIKYETLISDGGHTWMNCKLFLSTIAEKLFK